MKIFSTHLFSFFLLPFVFTISSGNLARIPVSPNFPVPLKTDKLLFYLQRTVNANTVLYELAMDKSGNINTGEPIKIQWIQYARDSTYEDLNYIQRNFAYGINVTLIDPVKKSFLLQFVSYKGKDLYLIRSTIDKKYHVYIQINNKLAILDKIFVQIEGGSLWVPSIKYVEISGTAPVTSERVIEKIRP